MKKNKKMFITEFEGKEQVPARNNELALMKFVCFCHLGLSGTL